MFHRKIIGLGVVQGELRRSHVETKMHCLKLLGQRLMARDSDRQVAEFQIRVCRPERLHRARRPRHNGRGITLFGERARPAISRFVKHV